MDNFSLQGHANNNKQQVYLLVITRRSNVHIAHPRTKAQVCRDTLDIPKQECWSFLFATLSWSILPFSFIINHFLQDKHPWLHMVIKQLTDKQAKMLPWNGSTCWNSALNFLTLLRDANAFKDSEKITCKMEREQKINTLPSSSNTLQYVVQVVSKWLVLGYDWVFLFFQICYEPI